MTTKRGNRIIYDTTTGKVIHQTGEAAGDILPHDDWHGIAFIEISYGAIDYSKCYIQRIDEDGNPVIMTYDISETEEQLRIRELEDALLLQTDLENGGIL